LLKFGYSYSTFIKRIFEVHKSTIREYKRKFFPNMAPSLSGRHTLISATYGITFPKKTVLSKLKTRKDVEIYPIGLETEVSYFKCLKLLKSMEFTAEKKEKTSAYSHSQIKKAKLG